MYMYCLAHRLHSEPGDAGRDKNDGEAASSPTNLCRRLISIFFMPSSTRSCSSRSFGSSVSVQSAKPSERFHVVRQASGLESRGDPCWWERRIRRFLRLLWRLRRQGLNLRHLVRGRWELALHAAHDALQHDPVDRLTVRQRQLQCGPHSRVGRHNEVYALGLMIWSVMGFLKKAHGSVCVCVIGV